MKNRNNGMRFGVILVNALASLLVACAVPEDGGRKPQGEPEGSVPRLDPDDTASTAPDQDKEVGAQLLADPSISPSTAFQDIASNGTYSCASGNFCAIVGRPSGGWRVFKLFNCTTYSVFNWNGFGFYFDNQTDNPATIVFDEGRVEIRPPSPIFPGGGQQGIDWSPVWFIRNC